MLWGRCLRCIMIDTAWLYQSCRSLIGRPAQTAHESPLARMPDRPVHHCVSEQLYSALIRTSTGLTRNHIRTSYRPDKKSFSPYIWTSHTHLMRTFEDLMAFTIVLLRNHTGLRSPESPFPLLFFSRLFLILVSLPMSSVVFGL